MGIPCGASNTFTLEMAGEQRTLAEELKEKGYGFDPETWTRYEEHREERAMNFSAENFTEGPAFKSSSWKEAGRTSRSAICRTTVHGFHFYVCAEKKCYSPGENCSCIYCGGIPIHRYHILSCTYFNGWSIERIGRECTKD